MNYLLKNGFFYIDGKFVKTDLLIQNGLIAEISPFISDNSAFVSIELNNRFVFPGFIDVHVHLREPGFSYKETIKTGTMAAAHGGYTTVCSMPNLNPAPDCYENLKAQLDIIERDACINVIPYGTLSMGRIGKEISKLSEMNDYVVGFSDDGTGLNDVEIMKEAMKTAKKLDKVIAAHCEDLELVNGGYIHDGKYAKAHKHKGINSESEWMPVERDLKLVEETGCKYHVCHVSTKETVKLIREAKKNGINVTCETAPHYLVLNDEMLEEDGRFKMNPPIRDEEDRLELIKGLVDGTIDMIATDHAPHSEEEKSRGLEKSPMGVVGLETAFPILYTYLVMKNIISLEELIKLMSINPMKRFNIGSELKIGENADLTVFDLEEKDIVDPENFLSLGRSTPFKGFEVYGKCKMTMVKGRIVWQENLTER